MRLHSLGKEISESVARHGLPRAFVDISIRAINHAIFFKILKFVHIEVPDPAFLALDPTYRCGFLDKSVLQKYCDQEHDLSEEFLHSAFSQGAECFGIREGDALASYGWYSRGGTHVWRPRETSPADLRLHFDDGYVYMFKGFTRADYRGRRLHAIGMTLALKEYRDTGFKGLVSYVEANNFDSLKSVYRMGYRDCGDMYIVATSDRYLTHRTPGCADYGLSLESVEHRMIQVRE